MTVKIEKKEITKKHLKVLLLDLYVAWNTDPKLEIIVNISPNSYSSVKRYNKLDITSTIIDVVKVLKKNNLISFKKNSEDNEIQKELDKKSEEFKEAGGNIYVKQS